MYCYAMRSFGFGLLSVLTAVGLIVLAKWIVDMLLHFIRHR